MKDLTEHIKILKPKMLPILDNKLKEIFQQNNLNFAKYGINWEYHLKLAFHRCRSLNLSEARNLKILDLATGAGFFPYILSENNSVLGTENVILPNDSSQFYSSIHKILDIPCDYFKIEKQKLLPLKEKYDIITSFSIRWDLDKKSGTRSEWDIEDGKFFLEDLIQHLNPEGKIYLMPFKRSIFKRSQKFFENKFGKQVKIL